MSRRRWIVTLALVAAWCGVARADLDAVRAEPNLEKRSKVALDYAADALKAAREAYRSGDEQAVAAAIKEVDESVTLAYDSLLKTGKDPRKSPRWFKRAEIATRDLLRSIESLEREMAYNDRAPLDQIKERVQQVHDNLLTGLMEGKHK